MWEILSKALSLLLIIAIGYGLKRVHFFSAFDYRIISKIVLNLTLPCAVITSFAAGFQRDASLFYIVGIGLAANLVLFAVGVLMARRKGKNCKYFYGLNIPGYSIGTFIIPFAQSFVGPGGCGGRLHVRHRQLSDVYRLYILYFVGPARGRRLAGRIAAHAVQAGALHRISHLLRAASDQYFRPLHPPRSAPVYDHRGRRQQLHELSHDRHHV